MDWEWLLAIPASSTAVATGWVIARASNSTLQVSKEADYKRIEAGKFERLLREGRLEQYVVDTLFPTRWWWRPAEVTRFRRDLRRYVGIAFFFDPVAKTVTQTLLLEKRRTDAAAVFHSIRDIIGIRPEVRALFPPGKHDAVTVFGHDFAVFIWGLDQIPKRRDR